MAAVSVEVPEDLFNELHRLAEQSGRTESDYILEALEEHLGDIEDYEIATARMKDHKAGLTSSSSLADVERELGLVD